MTRVVDHFVVLGPATVADQNLLFQALNKCTRKKERKKEGEIETADGCFFLMHGSEVGALDRLQVLLSKIQHVGAEDVSRIIQWRWDPGGGAVERTSANERVWILTVNCTQLAVVQSSRSACSIGGHFLS